MKHAFLILAHNNFNVTKALFHQLDDADFEIFIHINAKVAEFPREDLESCVSRARLHFVQRVPIGYCNYSMVEGVKSLMRSAGNSYHDYYHLLSGADLMSKTRDEFKKFFEVHRGTEFVGFSKSFQEDNVKYRNFFVANCRQDSHWKSVFFIRLRRALISLQKSLLMENCPPCEVKKGTDWYSITHDAMMYLLEEEPKFKRYFYRAYCPTEFFAQTILWNSPFRERLSAAQNEFDACLRTIDWDRGSPYVYRRSDEQMLLSAPGMFARKFDENVDMEIVDKLKSLNDTEA